MKSRNVVLIFAMTIGLLAMSSLVQAQPGPKHRSEAMELDRVIRVFVLANQLEIQPNAPERPVNFEALSWIGGDYRRLFIRAQGEQSTLESSGGELQLDALFGRLITPFWSVVGGARLDTRPRLTPRISASTGSSNAGSSRVTRGMLGVGFMGLAPGWFELDPILLVSDKGDVSTEIEASFDLLLTQRLIIQPRMELNAAVQAVPEIGLGSGLNDVELEARMRYEFYRKFAPYIGVSWTRRTGGTAAMARSAGEPLSVRTFTAGVRIWR